MSSYKSQDLYVCAVTLEELTSRRLNDTVVAVALSKPMPYVVVAPGQDRGVCSELRVNASTSYPKRASKGNDGRVRSHGEISSGSDPEKSQVSHTALTQCLPSERH